MRWLALLVAVTALASPALADDINAADAKFAEATKLRDEGKIPQACEAFSASLALNPNAIGTILNVARCAEESGQIATAIHYFSDARDRAREQNLGPQLEAAEEHLGKLTSRAPHLAIAFSETYPGEAKLLVANKVIDFATASDILVDPGLVQVVLSAPGRVPYSTTVEVGEAQHKALAIPKLGYPVTVCKACRTVGKALVGVGGAAFLTSVVLAWKSHSDWSNATAGCTNIAGVLTCDQANFDKANRALSLGDAATVVGIAGGVLAVGGAALWYFSPKREEDSTAAHVSIVPVVTPDQAGLAAVGRF